MTDCDSDMTWLRADWPAPAHVRAGTSLRSNGVSRPPYAGLNLASHVGDSEANARENRVRLAARLRLESEPVWLEQRHGKHIISLDSARPNRAADGAITTRTGRVCAVLTADCAPVLLCNRAGSKIAAIHAGWRGIAAGIIENALRHFAEKDRVMLWIGPCIGPLHYEVGRDVYSACIRHSRPLAAAFTPKSRAKWHCDLAGLVQIIAQNNGVESVHICELCTFANEAWFYSHRRDGPSGRMASLIWMAPRLKSAPPP